MMISMNLLLLRLFIFLSLVLSASASYDKSKPTTTVRGQAWRKRTTNHLPNNGVDKNILRECKERIQAKYKSSLKSLDRFKQELKSFDSNSDSSSDHVFLGPSFASSSNHVIQSFLRDKVQTLPIGPRDAKNSNLRKGRCSLSSSVDSTSSEDSSGSGSGRNSLYTSSESSSDEEGGSVSRVRTIEPVVSGVLYDPPLSKDHKGPRIIQTLPLKDRKLPLIDNYYKLAPTDPDSHWSIIPELPEHITINLPYSLYRIIRSLAYDPGTGPLIELIQKAHDEKKVMDIAMQIPEFKNMKEHDMKGGVSMEIKYNGTTPIKNLRELATPTRLGGLYKGFAPLDSSAFNNNIYLDGILIRWIEFLETLIMYFNQVNFKRHKLTLTLIEGETYTTEDLEQFCLPLQKIAFKGTFQEQLSNEKECRIRTHAAMMGNRHTTFKGKFDYLKYIHGVDEHGKSFTTGEDDVSIPIIVQDSIGSYRLLHCHRFCHDLLERIGNALKNQNERKVWEKEQLDLVNERYQSPSGSTHGERDSFAMQLAEDLARAWLLISGTTDIINQFELAWLSSANGLDREQGLSWAITLLDRFVSYFDRKETISLSEQMAKEDKASDFGANVPSDTFIYQPYRMGHTLLLNVANFIRNRFIEFNYLPIKFRPNLAELWLTFSEYCPIILGLKQSWLIREVQDYVYNLSEAGTQGQFVFSFIAGFLVDLIPPDIKTGCDDDPTNAAPSKFLLTHRLLRRYDHLISLYKIRLNLHCSKPSQIEIGLVNRDLSCFLWDIKARIIDPLSTSYYPEFFKNYFRRMPERKERLNLKSKPAAEAGDCSLSFKCTKCVMPHSVLYNLILKGDVDIKQGATSMEAQLSQMKQEDGLVEKFYKAAQRLQSQSKEKKAKMASGKVEKSDTFEIFDCDS